MRMLIEHFVLILGSVFCGHMILVDDVGILMGGNGICLLLLMAKSVWRHLKIHI